MKRYAPSRLPIKWKLTLWSSVLLFLVFIAYNTVQYYFVEKWMMRQEEQAAEQTMREILNFALEREISFAGADLDEMRSFLQKINQHNQRIRILDGQGVPVAVVSDGIEDILAETITRAPREQWRSVHISKNLLLMERPITIFQFDGTVEIVKNIQEFEKLSGALFRFMAIGCLAAVIVSGLGGRLLARQLVKPLQAMNETMKNVKQKGLSERVEFYDNHDELATTMKMFNAMMDKLERSFQQQRQFVEDASHELRTPIAIVEGHLGMLRRWGKHDPAVLEESLQISVEELSRLKALVEELLVLTRAENLQMDEAAAVCEPEQVISQTVKKVNVLHPAFIIERDLQALSGVKLAISAEHLEQILLILLDNAVKYSRERKRIAVRAAIQGERARLEIIDAGIGIPAKDLPYVTDRLYRVDKARNRKSGATDGNGLGLSIAKRLVERYNGALTIESVEQEGTTVNVLLPIRLIAESV